MRPQFISDRCTMVAHAAPDERYYPPLRPARTRTARDRVPNEHGRNRSETHTVSHAVGETTDRRTGRDPSCTASYLYKCPRTYSDRAETEEITRCHSLGLLDQTIPPLWICKQSH